MLRTSAVLTAFLLCVVPAQACGLFETCKPAVVHVAKKAKPHHHIDRVKPLESRIEVLEKRLSQDEVIVRSWIKSTAAAHSRLDSIPGK